MSLGSRQEVLNKMLPYLALIELTLHYKRQTKSHEEKFETMKKKALIRKGSYEVVRIMWTSWENDVKGIAKAFSFSFLGICILFQFQMYKLDLEKEE